MRFQIVFSNLTHITSMEDCFVLLRLLIESAGHQVRYDNRGVASVCNILFEGFTPSHVETFRTLQQRGSDSIIVATEYVTGRTFNDFARQSDARPGDGHYGNRAYWKERFENFLGCARYARAIWCASSDPQQIAAYQDLLEGVPVLSLPFPYFAAYPRLTHCAEKDIDVFFSGNRTEHRVKILERLSARCRVSATDPHMPDAVRRDLVARSKICLNLKQSPAWQFPSPMRYWYHLSNAAFLLGEQCQASCALTPYVFTLPQEHFDETCRELLLSNRWQRLADEAHQRFAAECPGHRAAEELIDRSFSTHAGPPQVADWWSSVADTLAP